MSTSLSAKEAADLTGMSKPGIIKAMRQGRISATKDHNGDWRVEPVELFRVYPPVSKPAAVVQNAPEYTPEHIPEHTPENTPTLQVENEQLRQRLADKDDVIDDLRQRLDKEADERRRLTMILTDSRPAAAPEPAPAPKRKPWWLRLFEDG